MSEIIGPVLTAFIATIPATIAAITALIVVLRSSSKVAKVEANVEKIEKATNSMKDALVASALVEGHAEGVKDEKIRKLENNGLHAAGVKEGVAVAAEKARNESQPKGTQEPAR